jgi:hypothetical protein
LIRPTRDAPSIEPDAAGLDRSMSAVESLAEPAWFGGAEEAGGGATSSPSGAPIEMIGVPTGTVSPSGTSSARTVPSNGEGSSTSDLAVSISTTTSLISTVSPTLTFQATISASVRPSPTSGRRNSDIRILSEPVVSRLAALAPQPPSRDGPVVSRLAALAPQPPKR